VQSQCFAAYGGNGLLISMGLNVLVPGLHGVNDSDYCADVIMPTRRDAHRPHWCKSEYLLINFVVTGYTLR
jgi:hypothetical protein